MADDGVCVVLVFFQEFLGTRECYLVDVFLDVVGGHADAMVGHGKCACLLVDSNLHTHIVERALEVAESGESFQFLGRVDGIGYQFAQKDFVIAVEKFFDNGEDVFGCYPDCAFFRHISVVCLVDAD